MGIQMKGSPMTRQSSWGGLPLEEVRNKCEESGKSMGSMNLDELLKNVWAAEANQFKVMEKSRDAASPSCSLTRHQQGCSLTRAMSAKTVDELWKEIQHGQMKMPEGGDQKLGEMTLEDFLVQAGLVDETSRSPSMGLDHSAEDRSPQGSMPHIRLSSAPSIGSLSDVTTTATRRKRGDPEAYEKAIERRLKRKIKNRESAARSRARKQAYQNELVTKVSLLEEENIRLKKEKEFDAKFPCELSAGSKYQLRRTASGSM